MNVKNGSFLTQVTWVLEHILPSLVGFIITLKSQILAEFARFIAKAQSNKTHRAWFTGFWNTIYPA